MGLVFSQLSSAGATRLPIRIAVCFSLLGLMGREPLVEAAGLHTARRLLRVFLHISGFRPRILFTAFTSLMASDLIAVAHAHSNRNRIPRSLLSILLLAHRIAHFE